MKRITLKDFDWTISANQKRIFTDLWSEGAEPTLTNAMKAQSAKLSLVCAARNLLSGKHLTAFFDAITPLRRRYRRTLEPHIARLKELLKAGDRGGYKLAEADFEVHKRKHWAMFQEEIAAVLVEEYAKQKGGHCQCQPQG